MLILQTFIAYNKHNDPDSSVVAHGWVLCTTSRIKYLKCKMYALHYNLYYCNV